MGRKSGILLIVAGTLLTTLPPAMMLAISLVFRSDHMLQDTYYVSFHAGAGGMLVMAAWGIVGIGLLVFGIRSVLRAP